MILPPEDVTRNRLSRKSRQKALERGQGRKGKKAIGLARAKAKAGDVAGSKAAYKQFLSNWRAAAQGLPELKEARAATGG